MIRSRPTAALLLLIIATLLLTGDPTGSSNSLSVTDASGTVPLKILTPEKTLETFDQIYALRKQVLLSMPGSFSIHYHPYKAIFESAGGEGTPWETVQRFFVYGVSEAYSPGAPADGLALVNPLLLIDLNFLSISIRNQPHFAWDFTKLNRKELNLEFPFRPLPTNLTFDPGAKRARVTYDITAYLQATEAFTSRQPAPESILTLPIFFNAADFGYKSVELSSDSSKISVQAPGPQALFSAIMPMEGSCSDKGCNAIVSSAAPFTIEKLPATAVFKLWKTKPASTQEPDLFYTAIFR